MSKKKENPLCEQDALREKPSKGKPLCDNHLESVLRKLYPQDYDWEHCTSCLRDDNDKIIKDEHNKGVIPDFISRSKKIIRVC